jgi:tryptophanyl-tRNA synthetase
MYYYIYHLICNKIKLNDLTKVFNINYNNNTDNNFAKLSYPVLMCLDIIMMQPCHVVVSIDQIHNVRFIQAVIHQLNQLNSKLQIKVEFKILDLKIMDFSGKNKMSTSINSKNTLYVDLTEKQIHEIVGKSITQNNMPQCIEECNDSVLNLYSIYRNIAHITMQETVDKFKQSNFTKFKTELAIKIVNLYNFYNQEHTIRKEFNMLNTVNKIHSSNYQLFIDMFEI